MQSDTSIDDRFDLEIELVASIEIVIDNSESAS